jgi:ankyrin repeat protein
MILSLELGHLSIVQYLVEKGAKIDAKNDEGNTPLHLASMEDHLLVLKYLLEKGAQVTNSYILFDNTMKKS